MRVTGRTHTEQTRVCDAPNQATLSKGTFPSYGLSIRKSRVWIEVVPYGFSSKTAEIIITYNENVHPL